MSAGVKKSSRQVKWTRPTNALGAAREGLKIVDGLMAYASPDQGRPSNEEKSLYMASVVFAYSIWEDFVERLAIELVERLSAQTGGLRPDQLDSQPRRGQCVRQFLEKGATAWDLSVHPGWRELWVRRVRKEARGDESGDYGINSANVKNTRRLFGCVGVDPLPADKEVEKNLDSLFGLRSEIVHTAKSEVPIYKAEVGKWRDFVHSLCKGVDKEARSQCAAWLEG